MTPDRQFRSPVRHFWRWLIPALLLWAFALQGTRGLWSPDEGRYVDVALEMLKSGDWLRPHVNDEFAHVTKPPLTYWAVASSVELFGRHEWAARLPHALAFALSVLLVGAMGRRLVPERPWLPALVYATFVLPYVAAHVITTDTLLAFFTSAYAAAFIEARARRDGHGADWCVAGGWAAAGLAFLAKGPPGLLPLAGLALFAWSERRIVAPSLYLSWGGMLLFALLGFGWYVRVAIDQPDLVKYFLVDEFWSRLSSPQARRNADAIGAVRVYGGTLLLGTLPWTWPLLRDLGRSLRQPRALPLAWRADPLSRLLACWILVPLAAFVLARSRLPFYLLPLFAPLALMAARAVWTWSNRRVAMLALAGAIGLLALRAFGALVVRPEDDRALARAIAALPVARIDEVAFVNTAPRYGLGFYLDAEVVRLTLGQEQPRALPPGRRTEVAPVVPARCRVLLVEARSAAALRRNLATDVGIYRRIGDAGRYGAYIVPGSGCD
jgi:4-amino-4-deoxy-L-arabinose transferase